MQKKSLELTLFLNNIRAEITIFAKNIKNGFINKH